MKWRWPWSRQPTAAELEAQAAARRAHEAAERATQRVEQVRAVDPEVHRIAAWLRELREANDLASLVASAFRERR